MLETMYEHNGVGLAGPQVGVAKRIFVALETHKDEETAVEDSSPPLSTEEKRQRWGVVKEHIIINPVISQPAGKAFDTEGCLSIPGLYVEKVERFFSLILSYQDLEGKPQQLEAEGHFARVIQHETDHLDGVLFIDRLTSGEKQNFMNTHRQELAEMQRDAKVFLKNLHRQVQPLKVS